VNQSANPLAVIGQTGLALPDDFYAAAAGLDAGDIGGGLVGGGFNRIALRQGSFIQITDAGEVEVPTKYLDGIIIAGNPDVSRQYFEDAYVPGSGQKPACTSHNGVTPDFPARVKAGTPASRMPGKSCNVCPLNVSGSGKDGKGRACAFRKRIVLISAEDLFSGVENPTPYVFDVSSMSMFGDGWQERNMYSFQQYVRELARPRDRLPGGIPVQMVVTRIVFDTRQTVPVVVFNVAPQSPQAPSFLSGSQAKFVKELGESDAVTRLLTVSEYETGAPAAPAGDVGQTQSQPIDTSGLNRRAPAPAPAPTPRTWQQVALEGEADPDDIESVEAVGGPYTVKGKKLWDALIGMDLPEEPKAATPPPPPPAPVPLWSDGLDADTIEMVTDAGGPESALGAKLIAKFRAKVGAAAPAPAPAASGSKGRGRKTTPAAETPPPAPAPAPAQTPPPATTNAAAAPGVDANQLGNMMNGFDDES